MFFTWIPALIFFLIEKDKGNPHVRAYHADNLNFSLMRVGIWIVIYVLGWIPYIGWLIGLVLWIGVFVFFVFHIIAAAKAPRPSAAVRSRRSSSTFRWSSNSASEITKGPGFGSGLSCVWGVWGVATRREEVRAYPGSTRRRSRRCARQVLQRSQNRASAARNHPSTRRAQ
ncbi:DUF4870 domain-containing protein [Leucobacter insecticola]|uniref:DUF4870 domain-containing protein n=1 Tax=Leucobacter insecticola TaxID=2714934 RepID=A0A6G8FG96_9MICO|nr:DUF4870 domain-containing protein [Leucobacter insecticola]